MKIEDFLVFCKITGSAIVLVTGILGILLETHDEKIKDGSKKKVLNRNGWIFLVFTGLSGGMALFGTWGEIIKNRIDDESRKKQDRLVLNNLQNQGAVALKSLNSIQHMVTRFDSFKTDAYFDIPLSNVFLTDFTNHLLQMAQALPWRQPQESNDVLEVSWNDDRSISSIYFKLDEASLNFLSNGPPAFQRAAPFFSALQLPILTIIFNRSNLPPKDISFHFMEGSPSGEFLPGAPWGKFKGSVLYYPKHANLRLMASSKKFTREEWVDRAMISSLWELGNAHCFFALGNDDVLPREATEENAILRELSPVELVLRFDNRSLKLTNFSRFQAAFGHKAYQTQLPGPERIINSISSASDDLFP
jgi:hypothetical protein